MNIDILLNRLDGVKQLPKDIHAARYVAKCPAHDDTHPSLAVTLTHQNQVLVHCRAHCGGIDVLAAVGLEFKDLHDRPLDYQGYKRVKRAYSYQQLFEVFQYDIAFVMQCNQILMKGEPLPKQTLLNLYMVAEKLAYSLRAANNG
jgi:hypothetical protein